MLGGPVYATTDQISGLVALLDQRQASIWHACQLTDLRSYLQIGGVPSRRRLERERLGFTPFVSDAQDRGNGVWDKVFFNLGDYGRPFAWGMRATPCVYGPIALQFAPRALAGADDVAICLRSAAARGFDRVGEALAGVEDVERLYSHPVEAGFPYSSFVKHGDSLREAFPFSAEARRPEVSCTVAHARGAGPEAISLDALVVIWVDRMVVGGRPLVDEVRETVAAFGLATPVHERSTATERRIVQQDIADQLRDGFLQLKLLPSRRGVATETAEWSFGVMEAGLDWLWERYAQYLIEGTLKSMGPTPTSTVRMAAPSRPASRPVRIAEVLDRFKEQ
jgi:hypothetical protein